MKQLQTGQHFGAAKKTLQLEGTILTEAGYTADEIDGLVDRHVIIAAASKAPELAR